MRLTTSVAGRWGGFLARLRASRAGSMLTSAVVVAGLTGGAAGCSVVAGVASCSSSLSTSSVSGSSLSGALAGQEKGLAAPGSAHGSLPGQPGSGRQAASSTVVTLPTGDQVQVGATGASPVLVKGRGTGGSPGFAQFTWEGDQYVIPYEAVPYLGTVLDPRLFDVSYLARLGASASTRLPVQVTYASATAKPALPGVQVTRRTGSTATAVISRAQAPKLARELESRWPASTVRRSVPSVDPIPGLAKISLAPPAGAPTLPAWPLQAPESAAEPGSSTGPAYHTLTLNFTDANGQPATAIGWVQNLSDPALGLTSVDGTYSDGPVSGTAGPVSLSLPDGTYSIQFAVFTPHPGTFFEVDAALVVKPQVTIDSNQSITLDARTAVPFKVSLTGAAGSPSLQNEEIDFTRISAAGGGCRNGNEAAVAFEFIGSSAFSATPTPDVTMGSIGFDATESFLAGGSSPASYYLVFPDTEIPSSLNYTVTPADLTTVHEQVYAPPDAIANCGSSLDEDHLFPTAYLPWGSTMGSGDTGWSVGSPSSSRVHVTPTGQDTVYWYTSNPQLTTWQDAFDVCGLAFPGQFWHIKPGQQISQIWGRYPWVPEPGGAFPNILTSSPVAVCAACRQDSNFEPEIWPAAAFNLGNLGGTYDWAFYQNGQLIEEQPYDSSIERALIDPRAADLPLSQRPATYQLDWTTFHGSDLGSIDPGASTETDWTFHSGPSDPAARLPAGEVCAPDPSRSCQFLPLLFIDYDLALNYSEQATAGQPFTIDFTVAHQPGEVPPAGVTATVSASFDDGQTWSAAQTATSLGNDRFAVTIDQPALPSTNGFASLRVTATDNAGNSVTQTVIDAYHLTS